MDNATRVGELTGAYVLANRTPAPARLMLKALPPALAARLCASPLERHAWTFGAAGRCSVSRSRQTSIRIEGNPFALPGCPWPLGVLTTPYSNLVGGPLTIRHDQCFGHGAEACVFTIGPPAAKPFPQDEEPVRSRPLRVPDVEFFDQGAGGCLLTTSDNTDEPPPAAYPFV